MEKDADTPNEPATKRVVKIRGKPTTFTSRVGRDGKIRYYRSGKPATSSYQRRLARGVLRGLSPQEARGKQGFESRWGHTFYGRPEINEHLSRFAGPQPVYGTETGGEVQWAAPPRKSTPNSGQRHRYYALVSIASASLPRDAYEIPNSEDACIPLTFAILKRREDRLLTGLTYDEFKRDFEEILAHEIERRGLELCSGNLRADTLGVWRHATK
jgi:hypothetical protein